MNKIRRFQPYAGKLASDLKINITKMGKMLKSEKFMIIFAKTWTEKRKLS